MEAMLKKEEEAREEGRVKKNLKKRVQFGASLGPRGLTGAQEQNCASDLYNWRWAPHGLHSAAKIQIREFRVSTPYISFLTPPKPLSKPHLHENKVAMLGFTENLSNPLIPLPFP